MSGGRWAEPRSDFGLHVTIHRVFLKPSEEMQPEAEERRSWASSGKVLDSSPNFPHLLDASGQWLYSPGPQCPHL